MRTFLSSVSFLIVLSFHEGSCETGADVDNLLQQLISGAGYNKKIRPLQDQLEVMNIFVEFYLNSVIEFDEQNEVLKTAGYLSLEWIDDYLKWTPADYNNTFKIFLPQDDIWKPDISLRNTYKTFTGLGSSFLNARITYKGEVEWNPLQILESTCSVNIRYFPFDTQTCELRFTAWSYSKAQVDLDAGQDGVTLEDYTPNAQWTLSGTSYREVNTGEAAVIFEIKLTRKPIFYLINIIVPVVLLSFLNILTFLLPVSSGEKASYAVTVFLSLAVFLTIVASSLPKNADVVSLLSIYLTMMTCLSTFIVVVCLLQLRLATRGVETPISKAFLLLIEIALILRCKKRTSNDVKPLDRANKKSEMKEEKRNTYDWTDVNNSIDFLFFWLTFIVTFICTISMYGACTWR